MDSLSKLYQVILDRKTNFEEGSYTCYLFEKGLDKILKKCGEENAEMLIAAKNEDKEELKNEVCDLFYHVLVMLAEKDVDISEVLTILDQRSQKIGNLKTMRNTDKNT